MRATAQEFGVVLTLARVDKPLKETWRDASKQTIEPFEGRPGLFADRTEQK